MTSALFYIFSAVLLFAASRVITARGTVHAVLYLVLAFVNAACLWLLLQAEFLAILLVLVYVGAVMVLFLFVVMMLDVDIEAMRHKFWRHLPVAGLIGALIAIEMSVVLFGGFKLTEAAPADPALAQLGNTRLLGIEIYTKYLYPVQVAAVVLLVAMVSAIVITLRRRDDVRYSKVHEQLRVKKADRLRVVRMPTTVETPSPLRDGLEGEEGATP